MIPINCQYELSAWIYRVIARADETYAAFLHEQGFRTGRKSFKFFTFSSLDVPRRAVEGDRLRILSDTVRLKISFLLDAAAEHFIVGLFKGQRMELADRKSRAAFQVVLEEKYTGIDWPELVTFEQLNLQRPSELSRTIYRFRRTKLDPDC